MVQSARDHELCWPVAQAAFAVAAQAALPKTVPAVEHLGIDETRRGKARFRLVPGPDGGEVWEVMADRWHIGYLPHATLVVDRFHVANSATRP